MSTKHWTAKKIRKQFLSFFEEKGHKIVNSAPLVLKDDPTLLFTNAGMNQFKDYFLNYKEPEFPRVADTQKCLRVSGKHNDLEDVGMDTYHHTMFEMLGNWSFGDYFKEEAITWAWELLTEVFAIDKDRIYVTVFKGDSADGLKKDQFAYNAWKKYIAEERILDGNKADNFWEMGETGPCGPCSEIHIDIRSAEDRAKIDGSTLINQDHPQVIEVWNLVFMQYNRKATGELEKLPKNHIDTGMGFERLCMVLQNKQSNYDTDIFTPLLKRVEELSNLSYQKNKSQQDIAMRVIVDHIRAISFAIADGQLPSNTGAGYVIRRILRRAVRYGYSFLNLKEAFLFKLVPVLESEMGEAFPELTKQQKLIENVIFEEENSFLRTLDSGLKKLDIISDHITGKEAFELYDTYGFPFDLTQLIASEKGFSVDEDGFKNEMEKQKERSRKDAKFDTSDWTILREGTTEFVGYDQLNQAVKITRYRIITQKNKKVYQLVLDKTPFYAESGGQIGDTGVIEFEHEQISIFDTKRENNLIIHFADKLPKDVHSVGLARVNKKKRSATENNHTATHLLHAALKHVLGNHVEQKGSLVSPEKLRFDFSHFSKLSDEELQTVENLVNQKISDNIQLHEARSVQFKDAIAQGATALFGEKYGDKVRVITFDPEYSVELCGGCHVASTAQIRFFKIINESAISAGVRRIEAITGEKAISFFKEQESLLTQVKALVKNDKNPLHAIEQLVAENKELQQKVDAFVQQQAGTIKQKLKNSIRQLEDVNFIGEVIDLPNANEIKNLAFSLKDEIDNLVLVLGAAINGKALLTVMISDTLVKEKNLNASVMIRELAKEIKGGGGGQPFYATAGGKDTDGLQTAVEMARSLLEASN